MKEKTFVFIVVIISILGILSGCSFNKSKETTEVQQKPINTIEGYEARMNDGVRAEEYGNYTIGNFQKIDTITENNENIYIYHSKIIDGLEIFLLNDNNEIKQVRYRAELGTNAVGLGKYLFNKNILALYGSIKEEDYDKLGTSFAVKNFQEGVDVTYDFNGNLCRANVKNNILTLYVSYTDDMEKEKRYYNIPSYVYVNNNEKNEEIKKATMKTQTERAVYDKFITEEASNKMKNHLISLEVKETQKVNEVDKSTSTDKLSERTYILKDYYENEWINITSKDYWLENKGKNLNDLVLYGKYTGIIEYEGKLYPSIEVNEVQKNIGKINIDDYKKIAEVYIDKLKQAYDNESFSFVEFKEDTAWNTLIYENENQKLKLNISIRDNAIWRVELDAISSGKDIDEIDQEFVKKVITQFDESIDLSNAEHLLKDAYYYLDDFKKHAYDKGYNYTVAKYNNIVVEEGITEATIEIYYND